MKQEPVEKTLSLTEVAKRCDVCLATAMKWAAGIRVGSETVRLECTVIGTRCRVTEEQLAKFQADCHKAKFGIPPVAPRETMPQRVANARRALERAGIL